MQHLDNQLEFLDILTILSFIISIENLQLNQEQSDNLEQHLIKQDNILLKEQNSMLETIIKQNEKIILLLKEFKNA